MYKINTSFLPSSLTVTDCRPGAPRRFSSAASHGVFEGFLGGQRNLGWISSAGHECMILPDSKNVNFV